MLVPEPRTAIADGPGSPWLPPLLEERRLLVALVRAAALDGSDREALLELLDGHGA